MSQKLLDELELLRAYALDEPGETARILRRLIEALLEEWKREP